jgi:hypothetical protein
MRFAYADPPYLGYAKAFYGDDTYDSIEAHRELIDGLAEYDGWAYSLTSTTLKAILPLCPDDVRIAAWVKPFCSFKLNVKPAYAWEPVIFRGGRKFTSSDRTPRDWLAASIVLKKGFRGCKPKDFSFWIFELLNMHPDDEFVDMFPGSGLVSDAWQQYRSFYKNEPTISLFAGVPA